MSYSEIKDYQKFIARPITGRNRGKVRCMMEPNAVFVYAKGSRKYGFRHSKPDFASAYEIIPVDRTEEWHKQIRRAVRCMESSGLWPDICAVFKNLLCMSKEDHDMLKSLYWGSRHIKDGRYLKKTGDEMDAEYAPYASIYPFLFTRDMDGHLVLDTDYIFETSDCVLKSMYFGKYENRRVKSDLKNAITEQKPYKKNRIRTSYDVSVCYLPDARKAFYSEEYRDCGNGHYYAMLDENTALHLEDD